MSLSVLPITICKCVPMRLNSIRIHCFHVYGYSFQDMPLSKLLYRHIIPTQTEITYASSVCLNGMPNEMCLSVRPSDKYNGSANPSNTMLNQCVTSNSVCPLIWRRVWRITHVCVCVCVCVCLCVCVQSSEHVLLWLMVILLLLLILVIVVVVVVLAVAAVAVWVEVVVLFVCRCSLEIQLSILLNDISKRCALLNTI